MPKKENNDYINDLNDIRANIDKGEGASAKTMTVEGLVHAVLGDDPKAVINAIQGKSAKRRGKNNPPDKYKNRTIGLNKDGKAVVKDVKYTESYLEGEKAKKAAAKKDKKEKEA